VVSVGSTPTSHFARNLDGVTEVRAGVYVFQDLVMVGIGVCTPDDIAISVVATVIGHRPEKGWIITDAGWMAMSRDRGTASQAVDQGYGLVTAMDGTPYEDLIVARTSQEHGTMAIRPGSGASLPDLPVGTRVRVYPNHACATTAQHDRYVVLPTGSDEVGAEWEIFRGW
jgi:D-serine deaminase-like pyridoxal phosphate-dependent protein